MYSRLMSESQSCNSQHRRRALVWWPCRGKEKCRKRLGQNKSTSLTLVLHCSTSTGMLPFSTLLLRSYYDAIGWNEDNLYSNITRSSAGKL